MKKIIKWLALLILILAGAFVYNGITNIGSMVPTVAAVMPPPEKIEVSRQAMLRALEGKLELTTASMRLEKFVPGGVCDGNTWQNFAYEDCVTMLVPAKINAGFDWGTFKPEQIKSTSERITVDIGTPKIFDVVIDHQNIKVIYRSDGAFVSPDKSLEMRVLAATEPAFKQDACHNDILRTASLTAEKRIGDILQALLRAAGDTREIVIIYTIPPC